MDMIEDLNYDCNYNLFLTLFGLKKKLKTDAERKRTTDWVTKIMKSNKTLSDLRLRNNFMWYLAMNVQNGELRSPFDQDPPRGPLKAIAKTLPGFEESHEDEDFSLFRFLPADCGGFLIPKPAPHVGAYCYLTALNNTGGP